MAKKEEQPTTDQSALNAALQKQIQKLEADLKKSQDKNLALNVMIDIAEEQGIRIRKKSGAHSFMNSSGVICMFGGFSRLFDWCKVTESVPKGKYSGVFFYQQNFNREINRWGIKLLVLPTLYQRNFHKKTHYST